MPRLKSRPLFLTDPSTRKRDDAHVVFGEVMVASFNAIDRAARELNVDARELAEHLSGPL
jgi:hypothetical protein